MQKLKVLDLFSGIGGFSLGLERTGGFETVAFCEIDPFCQKVLKKHWPDVPIYNDVRNLDYDGSVDVITGGYPCQPFSTAGKRQGENDDRHLWPAMFSLIKKHRPAWIIGENVAGHISMGLDNVLSDLGGANYTARTFVIPACAVDASHRRERTWVVAHADSSNGQSWQQGGQQEDKEEKRTGLDDRTARHGYDWDAGRCWAPEPAVGRVANGVPRRMDRLRSLGNAVVPQIPEIIGCAILETTQ